jgi:hypothetical protein
MFDQTKIVANSTSQVRDVPKKCECLGCNKKLMLTCIKCRCEKYFCDIHRYSDLHNCVYDYKLNNDIKLRKELIEVKNSKVDII